MGADSFPAATCLPATSNRRVLVVKLHVTSFWCRSLGHSASMITSLPALRHDIPMSAWKQCCSQAQVCINHMYVRCQFLLLSGAEQLVRQAFTLHLVLRRIKARFRNLLVQSRRSYALGCVAWPSRLRARALLLAILALLLAILVIMLLTLTCLFLLAFFAGCRIRIMFFAVSMRAAL
jgi:hypothetical protein